jgi:hypothetical protein
MAQLTAERIKNALTSLFSSTDSTDVDLMKKLLVRKTAVGYFTDGGTAGTAQTATAFFVNETGKPVKVTSAKFVTPIAVTANGSNYGTVTLAHRTSAGASATTIVSFATDTVTTDDLVAFAPKDITSLITAANAVIPAGGVATVALAKTGTGVAFAAATSQAYVSFEYEPVDS